MSLLVQQTANYQTVVSDSLDSASYQPGVNPCSGASSHGTVSDPRFHSAPWGTPELACVMKPE